MTTLSWWVLYFGLATIMWADPATIAWIDKRRLAREDKRRRALPSRSDGYSPTKKVNPATVAPRVGSSIVPRRPFIAPELSGAPRRPAPNPTRPHTRRMG